MTSGPSFRQRRKRRNWAMLIALLTLVVLFFAITYVKMSGAMP